MDIVTNPIFVFVVGVLVGEVVKPIGRLLALAGKI